MIHMDIRNLSTVKRLYTRGKLEQLAEKICRGEGLKKKVELSLLLCDDAFIRELNARYRSRDEATDVLSFEQESPKNMDKILLGDIVISLETVQRHYIHQVLHATGGNKRRAAEILGITRRTLYRWLE